MLFVIKQTVEFVNITDNIKSKDVFLNYISRAIGFELYKTEIRFLLRLAPPSMIAYFNSYFGVITDCINMMYTTVVKYYKVLHDELGYNGDDASIKTWKVFENQINEFAKIYYDLFEIKHYYQMLKHSKLVISDKAPTVNVVPPSPPASATSPVKLPTVSVVVPSSPVPAQTKVKVPPLPQKKNRGKGKNK